MHGVVVDPDDVLDGGQQALHVGRRLLGALEREDHIVGLEGVAVVERHALAQLEFPHGRVGRDLPGHRQRGDDFAGRVADEQRLIDLVHEVVGRPFVLRVRVERQGIRDPGPFQRAGIGRARRHRQCREGSKCSEHRTL